MSSDLAYSCLNCQKTVTIDDHQQYKLVASVSSDCRPQPWTADILICPHCHQVQKLTDAHYQHNVTAIYQSYCANPLTQGAEQLNYSASVPLPRCRQILHNATWRLEHWKEQAINVLDIGTGSGVMLDAIHAQFPEWHLYAQDVSDHQSTFLRNKLPLRGFIAGELTFQRTNDYVQQFDLVSMIHVLEHVLAPQQLLQQISRMLTDDGVLLIQVPNIVENPWDLGIYDHVQHFSPKTLSQLVQQVFPYVQILTSPIKKEITLLAANKPLFAQLSQPDSSQPATYPEPLSNIATELSRLRQQLNKADTCVLLGTGPAAGLLISHAKQWQLSHKIINVIDEDSRKWGSEFGGIKVVSPDNMPNDTELLLPYPESQRIQIEQRIVGKL